MRMSRRNVVETIVAVVREPAELARIVPEWEELAAKALEANPFYEHWFMLPTLEVLPSRKGFSCVLVWARDAAGSMKLGGLFPFQRHERYKGLPVAVLTSWNAPAWLLGTPLLRSDMAECCVQALLDWLKEDGRALAEFKYVPGDGGFHGILSEALRRGQGMGLATQSFLRPVLRCAANADRYLEVRLSSDARKALRRKERRLGERGELAHVALRPGDDAGRWIDEFLRLEASGWKGRAGGALASSAEKRRAASEILMAAHRQGRMQMVGIDCGGRAIARCCNLVTGATGHAYRTAYDEQYAAFSPGVMAEIDSIRAAHADPRLQCMDSVTDPDNEVLTRLWQDKHLIQTVMVAADAWRELWLSMLPLARWAKRRIERPARPAAIAKADQFGSS